MRRREENGSALDQPDWLVWLRGIVSERGYDIDSPRGGGKTRLAEHLGIAQSSVSRILSGTVPDYDTLVAFARSLDIALPELLIRTGKATESDFPQTHSINDQVAVSSGKPLTPEEVAIAAGVPEGDRDWFVTMIRRMRRHGNEGGSAGGAAAEG